MKSPLKISPDQARAFRLHRSFLLGNTNSDPIEIASQLCGVQAQVFSAGKLSLGVRSGKNAMKIDELFARKNGLIKTWTMRGTLHAVAASDLPLFSAALGFDTVDRHILHWKKNYGIEKENSIALIETLGSLLTSSPRTKREFSAEAADRLGEWVKPLIENGWGGAIKCLCNMGAAVFSEQKGQEVTFSRRERYITKWNEPDPHEAQDTLLRKYLSAFGPSTAGDFSYWLGRTVPFAQEIWKRIQPELQEVGLGGKQAFILKKDRMAIENIDTPSSHITLLPFFDIYLFPHRKKEHLVEAKHYKKIFRTAGWISQTLISMGKVKGIWELEKSPTRQSIAVKPFAKLTIEEKNLLRGKVADLENYYGMKTRLRIL
jgi:hypothetical protein